MLQATQFPLWKLPLFKVSMIQSEGDWGADKIGHDQEHDCDTQEW